MTKEAMKEKRHDKPKPYPFVCANCKWATVFEDAAECYRYPEPVAKLSGEWCGEFSAAVTRSMRTDIQFPPCQVVPE